jgi:hypothetical protein
MYWQQSNTDAGVEPGASAHPLLQDVSLFVCMMDCGAESRASSVKRSLHVSLRPEVTVIVAPENVGALKVAADAVLSHAVRPHPLTVVYQQRSWASTDSCKLIVTVMVKRSRPVNAICCVQALVQQAFAGPSCSALMTHGSGPYVRQDADFASCRGDIGSISKKPCSGLAGSLCIEQVNLLLSDSSLVAHSHATAEEILCQTDVNVFRCVLDGVFVNVMNLSCKQSTTVYVSDFCVLQQRQSQSLIRIRSTHEAPLVSSHPQSVLAQARLCKDQSKLSILSQVAAAWSRTAQVPTLFSAA